MIHVKIKSSNKFLKALRLILCAVLGLFLLMVGIFIVLYFGELSTIGTMERPDDSLAFFTMEYKADYGFDEFLSEGVSTCTFKRASCNQNKGTSFYLDVSEKQLSELYINKNPFVLV